MNCRWFRAPATTYLFLHRCPIYYCSTKVVALPRYQRDLKWPRERLFHTSRWHRQSKHRTARVSHFGDFRRVVYRRRADRIPPPPINRLRAWVALILLMLLVAV